MSLLKILEEIKKVKPFAEEEISSVPVETLSGRRGRKNQSIEQMKYLKRQYRQTLMQGAVFIVVTGAGREDFIKVASENFGVFTTDPETFYFDLAKRVPQTLYLGKEGVSNVFHVLGRHLEDKAMEMDIIGYPQLIFKAKYSSVLKSQEDFTSLVKRVVNEQIGAEMVGIQAVKDLTDSAIERDHAAKVTPIALGTGDEQLVVDLVRDLERLTPRVFLVVAGRSSKAIKSLDGAITVKTSDADSVEKALTLIKGSLKK